VGGDDAQFLKAYTWDGKALTPTFAIDFRAEKLGRPHIMRFSQRDFGRQTAERTAPAGNPG
jgi:hypothetical protein